MKILVVCQYYEPEPFRVHDLCAELVRRGHSVQVVTGMPNYPKGDFYPGYEGNKAADEVLDGVRVHRCPLHPRKHGAVHRLWNYASFPASAEKYILSDACIAEDGGAFDLVFIYQLSPVMMASPGIKYAEKHQVPVLLYCLDLWPESLLAGGVRKGSAVYRVFHRISKKIYTSVDRILTTSGQFEAYLAKEFQIPAKRIDCLPQYAETLFSPLPPRVPDGTCHLMFAGNLGVLQSLDTVLDAAALLRNDPVFFHIVGDGVVFDRLSQRVKDENLDHVRIYGRRPVEEMPSLYASTDAMLVTMKADPVLSLTLPGKVQSYLAAGKPVIGAINGEAAHVIADAACGFCGPAEDAAALAENIRRFAACADKETLGRNAAAYYSLHYAKDRFFSELEQVLEALRQGGRT